MNRILLVIIGAVLVFVVVATLTLLALRSPVTEANLAVYRKNLENHDPRLRVEAAVQILRTDPMDQPARLAYAGGLIDLGRYAVARDSLNTLARNQKAEGRSAALLLVAESYLAQSEEIVAESGANSPDLLAGKIDPLLTEAAAIGNALGDAPEVAVDRAMILARVHDVRATVLEAQLQGFEMELVKARAAALEDQIHLAGVQAGELRRRIEEEHKKIEAFTTVAIAADPTDARPHAMLFRMWMRVGEVAKARQAAGAMVNQPGLDHALAGRVALALLDQETDSGREVTAADRRLAEALLSHRNLTGPTSIRFDLAKGELALQSGNFEGAQTFADDVLRQYRDHPVALSQWARAMIGQNRAKEAVIRLVPITERTTLPLLHYVLGAAYLKSGDVKAGREVLRQALDQRPDLLPARLLLAESMVDTGFIYEAEPDILTAAAMSPTHPRVLALTARLLIEKLDGTGLTTLWREHLQQAGELTPEEIALAAGMVIDDVPDVKSLAEAMLEKDATNLAGVMGRQWTRATPRQRFFIASVVVAGCEDALDADPLRHALPPAIPILEGSRKAGILTEAAARAATAQAANATASATSSSVEYDPRRRTNAPKPDPTALWQSWFIPWPHESALDMVALATRRWPDDARLRRQAVLLAWMLGRREIAQQHLEQWKRLMPEDAEVQLVDETLNVSASPQLIAGGQSAFADERPMLSDWIFLAQAVNRGSQGATGDALQLLLSRHAWCEPAVLLPVRKAMAANDPLEARGYIELAKSANPQLASLALARFDLATGRPLDALHAAEMTISAEPGGSELRSLAGELRARSNLATGQMEIAVGAFENLALSTPHRQAQMQIAVVDVYLAAGRTPAASATITTTLADPRTTPRQMDALLARAMVVMPADRLVQLCNSLLRYRPGEGVLLAYKIQGLLETEQLPEASVLLRGLAEHQPDSPRVLILQGRLASRRGDVAGAMEAYQKLLRQGGASADAALRELENLTNNPPPVSAAEALDAGVLQ